MSMSKKDFIALADYIRDANRCMPNLFDKEQLDIIAAFCKQQNPRFMRDRWLGYIAGENGRNGGKVKVDQLAHRGRTGYCAKCGGDCEYTSDGVRKVAS